MACQNLQAFILTNVYFRWRLRHNRCPITVHGYEQQPIEEGISIGKYIGTILSGNTLERVELDASVLGLRALSREGARCPLGYALSRMTCTNMRVVSLTNIGISQKTVEHFANPSIRACSCSACRMFNSLMAAGFLFLTCCEIYSMRDGCKGSVRYDYHCLGEPRLNNWKPLIIMKRAKLRIWKDLWDGLWNLSKASRLVRTRRLRQGSFLESRDTFEFEMSP